MLEERGKSELELQDALKQETAKCEDLLQQQQQRLSDILKQEQEENEQKMKETIDKLTDESKVQPSRCCIVGKSYKAMERKSLCFSMRGVPNSIFHASIYFISNSFYFLKGSTACLGHDSASSRQNGSLHLHACLLPVTQYHHRMSTSRHTTNAQLGSWSCILLRTCHLVPGHVSLHASDDFEASTCTDGLGTRLVYVRCPTSRTSFSIDVSLGDVYFVQRKIYNFSCRHQIWCSLTT